MQTQLDLNIPEKSVNWNNWNCPDDWDIIADPLPADVKAPVVVWQKEEKYEDKNAG